jgi:hypothetical protein
MRKLLIAGLAVAGLLLHEEPVGAFGKHRRSGCAPVVACASPAPSGVACVEQTVTAYRPEIRTRVVNRQVQRLVTREVEESFTYTEMVTVSTPTKRTVTTYVPRTREVPYTYSVSVPVITPVKRTVTEYVSRTREVPYTYSVSVPVITPQKQIQTYYTCVPQEVICSVPVCRMVSCPVVDPCTGCVTMCSRPVVEMQAVKKVVMRSVAQTREVTVNVCRYEMQQRSGTRTVCEMIPQHREVTVNVCRYEMQQRSGTRTVCEMVAQSHEVTVNVLSCKPVERTGKRKRLVCDTVTETVPVTECYTVMVPYVCTVRVPACVPGCGY